MNEEPSEISTIDAQTQFKLNRDKQKNDNNLRATESDVVQGLG